MKMKKVIASIASAAMAASMLSAFSVSTSAVTAGSTMIDFEDGDCSFVYMNVDDAGSDNSTLSVEEYEGSMQLKVDVEDKTKTPKVWFDLDKITDRANTIQVRSIEMDLTFVPEDATQAMGWIGGAVGSAGGFDMNLDGKGQVNPSWAATDWSCDDNNAYVEGQPAKVHVVKKYLLPSAQYTEEGVNPFFGIMVWSENRPTDWVMYVDNIVLKDSAGNALPVGVTPAETEAAAEETEAAVEETEAAVEETEAPAETEAAVEETEAVVEEIAVETEAVVEEVAVETEAPVADAPVATTPAATGNAAASAIAVVMVAAGAVAVASKRK